MLAKTKTDWLKLYFVLLETLVLVGCALVFVDVFFVGEVTTRGGSEFARRLMFDELYHRYGIFFIAGCLAMSASIPLFSRCRPVFASWAHKTMIAAAACFLFWLIVLPALH